MSRHVINEPDLREWVRMCASDYDPKVQSWASTLLTRYLVHEAMIVHRVIDVAERNTHFFKLTEKQFPHLVKNNLVWMGRNAWPEWAAQLYDEGEDLWIWVPDQQTHDTVRHWLDYLEAYPTPKSHFATTIEDLVKQVAAWDKRLAHQKLLLSLHEGIEEVPNLWLSENSDLYMVKLSERKSFKAEGQYMRHCVGNGVFYMRHGVTIYSFRDKTTREPQWTVEVQGNAPGMGKTATLHSMIRGMNLCAEIDLPTGAGAAQLPPPAEVKRDLRVKQVKGRFNNDPSKEVLETILKALQFLDPAHTYSPASGLFAQFRNIGNGIRLLEDEFWRARFVPQLLPTDPIHANTVQDFISVFGVADAGIQGVSRLHRYGQVGVRRVEPEVAQVFVWDSMSMLNEQPIEAMTTDHMPLIQVDYPNLTNSSISNQYKWIDAHADQLKPISRVVKPNLPDRSITWSTNPFSVQSGEPNNTFRTKFSNKRKKSKK